jgi:hypothetical protein
MIDERGATDYGLILPPRQGRQGGLGEPPAWAGCQGSALRRFPLLKQLPSTGAEWQGFPHAALPLWNPLYLKRVVDRFP